MRSKKLFTNKYLFLFSIVFVLLLFLYPIPYTLPPVSADVCLTEGAANARANGLVSTRKITGKFGVNLLNGGNPICSVDTSTSFVGLEIPTYAEVWSTYYDQAKTNTDVTKLNQITGNANQGNFTFTNSSVGYVTGNLTLGGNPGGAQTGVVFVDGNTDINNNITYGSGSGSIGLVLIVQGNVNIHQSVTRVDAVIISSGVICTAYDGAQCPGSTSTCGGAACSQLLINGSLISLDETEPVAFRRTLGANDSTQPAEKIIAQPKFLVILRHIVARSLQKWTEVTGNSEIYVGCNTFNGAGNQTVCAQAGCQWDISTSTCSADTTAPTTVTLSTPTVFSDTRLDLSWTASTDAVGVTGYDILRCTGGGCNPTTLPIATVAFGTNSYSNTGLTGNTTYRYIIKAKDAAGNFSLSNIATQTTSATPDTTAPTAPGSLVATPVSTNQINLSWNASTDNVAVTGYDILRCVSGQSGLVSYWKMDETSGTTVADSITTNNNPGTATNGPLANQAGKIGTAWRFDNIDDFVNVGSPASTDNLPQITVSAWIYPTGEGEGLGGSIIRKTASTTGSNGWRLNIDGNALTNALVFNVDDGGTDIDRATTNNAIALNQWNHVVATWDGTSLGSGIHIYVNGTEATYQRTLNGGTKTTDAASNLVIGGRDDGGVTFDGTIDEVGLWNKVLTPSEVTALNNGTNGLSYGSNCVHSAIFASDGASPYNNTGLTASTSYNYIVKAKDAAGNISPSSNTATATTQSDFNYSLSNNSNITVGTTGASFNNITATLVAGTTQSVTLSITPVAGVAWGWGSNPVNPTSILSLTATTTGAASGNYPITVTGTSTGGVIRTTAFTLKITNFPVSGAVACRKNW